MKFLRGRTRTAVVLLPLLAAAVGCQVQADTDGEPAAASPSPTGKSVFEERLSDQLSAAARATAATGSARFTATLSYGAGASTAVTTTSGVLDYAKGAARVERAYEVPRAFPAKTADELGLLRGPRSRQVFAVDEDAVSYRTAQGAWLRYSFDASKEFIDAADDVFGLVGESEPWGGTLADVVRLADPERAPETGADGRRTYRVDVDSRGLTDLLPFAAGYAALEADLPRKVPMTVVLDEAGRLLRAEADYAPLLDGLHAAGTLDGVTSLRASYTLTGHGGQTVPAVPAGERTEDAERVTAALTAVKPGGCASTDTGLDSDDRVRPVACGRSADIRVFGRQRVDETYRDRNPKGLGRDLAAQRCGEDFRTAPAAWTKDARPSGYYQVGGTETVTTPLKGPESTVAGDFVCYVALR